MNESITAKQLAGAISATALDLYGRWEGTKATGFAGSALIEVQLSMELEPIIAGHMQQGRVIDAAYCEKAVEKLIEVLRETYGAKDQIDFSPEALIAAQAARDADDDDDDD
jgi:hypothetical protein